MKIIELLPDDQITVKLHWASGCDLDLVLFYQTQGGDENGVFSREYTGKISSEGSLDRFPYMQLVSTYEPSPDPLWEEERIVIQSLHDMKVVSICVINYSACIDGTKTNYSEHNGKLDISINDKITHTILMNNPKEDDIYLSFRIIAEENLLILEEMNNVITLNEAYDSIPGFSAICERE